MKKRNNIDMIDAEADKFEILIYNLVKWTRHNPNVSFKVHTEQNEPCKLIQTVTVEKRYGHGDSYVVKQYYIQYVEELNYFNYIIYDEEDESHVFIAIEGWWDTMQFIKFV